MDRDLVMFEALRRLRSESRVTEPLALELDLQIPYWPVPQAPPEESDEEPEEEVSRGVVIINMEDYSEEKP